MLHWFLRALGQKQGRATKRVFILSKHPLFGQGVEALLRQEPRMDIVGQETDIDQAIERIRELRPDVVIVGSSVLDCDPTPAVMQVSLGGSVAKVIRLDLQDNTLCIYRSEQQLVRA